MKKTIVFTIAALALATVGHAQTLITTTTGTYAATQAPNTSATTTGTGNELSLSTFTTNISNAFTAITGGVIRFDSGSINSNTTISGVTFNTISATYGTGQGKTLTITSGNGNWSVGAPADRTPVSSTFALGKQGPGATIPFVFDFSIGLQQVGVTVLSRGGRTSDNGATVTVTFNDLTTSSKYDILLNANGTDNTFFGFIAPTGKAITKLEFTPSPHFTSVDDLAFVVPEPTTFALLFGSAGLLLTRRRRK